MKSKAIRDLEMRVARLEGNYRVASTAVELTVNPEQAERSDYRKITYKGVPFNFFKLYQKYIFEKFEDRVRSDFEDRYGNPLKPIGGEELLYIGYNPKRDEFVVGQNWSAEASAESWKLYSRSGNRGNEPDRVPLSGYMYFKIDEDIKMGSVYGDTREWFDYRPLERSEGFVTVWKADWTDWGGDDA